jgi:hypothetical protein
VPLVPLRTWTGAELYDLARASRSPLSQWTAPIRSTDYQISLTRMVGEWLGGWTGFHRVERWAAWEGQHLLGAVETQANMGNDYFTLRFSVRPEARGKLERGLVGQGLRSLARAGSSPVIAEHDGEHAEGTAALVATGFRVQRDLITMRRAVRQQDTRH